MNILVTGGSGFIGTNLVANLMNSGHNVKIYDKRISDTFPEKCIVADIRDKSSLVEAAKGIDLVYHLAAEHHDNVRPKSLYYDVNVRGAENLVYALEANNIKKIIFTSSVAVYGLNSREPDENSPVKPFNEYGKSKYEAELVFNKWIDSDDKLLVIVRPSVVFGEKNRGNVYNLVSQIALNKFIMIGNGKNRKSMSYVLNIVNFLEVLMQWKNGFHLYNYADKPDLSMEQLVSATLEYLKKDKTRIPRIPYSVGLIGGYVCDVVSAISRKKLSVSSIRIKKFCAETMVSAEKVKTLDFEAPYTLHEGLKRMVQVEFSKA